MRDIYSMPPVTETAQNTDAAGQETDATAVDEVAQANAVTAVVSEEE